LTLPPSATPRPGHPELETLAAFAEGRLVGSDRRSVVEHLADCDDCRELVAESAGLVVEVAAGDRTGHGEVVPFPDRQRRSSRWVWAAGFAAALFLAAAIAVTQRRGPTPDVTLTALADGGALTELGDGWSDPRWSVTRGEGSVVSNRARAFRLGARSADLDLALAGGKRQVARRLAAESALLLGELPLAEPIAVIYRQAVERLVSPDADLAATRGELATARRLTRDAVDTGLFDLGRWAETCRRTLAARSSTRLPSAPDLRHHPAGLTELLLRAERPELGDDPARRLALFEQLLAAGGDLN